MQSKAASIDEYLRSLPEDRRLTVAAVRQVILDNLGEGYAEGMQYGMIGYHVPHTVYPPGYHCDPRQPLPFAALASQKNHLSLYLMGVYCGQPDADGETAESRRFRERWARTGKKLDMGKSCVRFKRLEDVALDVLGEAIRRLPVEVYVANYEAGLATMKKPGAKKPAAKKPAAKKPAAKEPAAKKPAANKPAAKSAR